ncbi:hypothetical protein P7C70_g8298, partial [Phenoliferia sp. Uapishka_3]
MAPPNKPAAPAAPAFDAATLAILSANPSLAPLLKDLLGTMAQMQVDAATLAAQKKVDDENREREVAERMETLRQELAGPAKEAGLPGAWMEGDDGYAVLERLLLNAARLDAYGIPPAYYDRYFLRQSHIPLTYFTDGYLKSFADTSTTSSKIMSDHSKPLDMDLDLLLNDDHQRLRAQNRFVSFVTDAGWYPGSADHRREAAVSWTAFFGLVNTRLTAADNDNERDFILHYVVKIFRIITETEEVIDISVWHNSLYDRIVATVSAAKLQKHADDLAAIRSGLAVSANQQSRGSNSRHDDSSPGKSRREKQAESSRHSPYPDAVGRAGSATSFRTPKDESPSPFGAKGGPAVPQRCFACLKVHEMGNRSKWDECADALLLKKFGDLFKLAVANTTLAWAVEATTEPATIPSNGPAPEWDPLSVEAFDLDAFLQEIVSPFKPAGFKRALEEIPAAYRPSFAHLPHCAEFGFPLGFTPADRELAESQCDMPKKSDLPADAEDRDLVLPYLNNEFVNKRMGPGMTKDQLDAKLKGRNFKSSPISVSRDGEKPRVVSNYTYSNHGRYPSTNDLLRHVPPRVPTHWTTFAETARIVAAEATTSQAFTYDASKAFRQLPAAPEDRLLTVSSFNGRYYLDGYALPWLHFGEVLGGRRVLHPAETSPGMTLDESALKIMEIFAELGIEMNVSKYTAPNEEFQSLGFTWNIRTKVVTLLEKKRAKYLELLRSVVVENYLWTLEVIEKLAGFLAWICYVEPTGRFHMQGIYSWQAKFHGSYVKRELVQGASAGRLAADLDFWTKLLASDLPISKVLLSNPYPSHPTFITSDSSDTHIGFLVGAKWEQIRLRSDWKGGKRGWNIDYPEAVGVEFAIRAFFDLHPDVREVTLTAFCDNTSVVDAWHAQRSRNPAVNATLLRLKELLVLHGCDLNLVWVDTKTNLAADLISRGTIPAGSLRWIPSSRSVLPTNSDLGRLLDS